MKLPKTTKIILMVVLVLLLGLGGFYLTKTRKNSSTMVNKTAESSPATELKSQEKFLYFSDGNYESNQFVFRVSKSNLANLLTTTEKFTIKFPLVGTSSFDNEPIQWSRDGKVMAYSYGDEGGEDAPSEANSYHLIAKTNNQEISIIGGIEVWQIKKWLLMPDGKSLYYIKSDSTEQNSKQHIYRYTFKNNQTEKLVETTQYSGSSSPWELLADNKTLCFIKNLDSDNRNPYLISYETGSNTLKETKLMENVDTSKAFMGTFSDGSLNISPDGKLIAYRDRRSETEHGIGIYNIETKQSYDLVSAGNQRSTNDISWSPDSKYITYVTTVFAAGDGQYEMVELNKVDISSKKKIKLDESESGNSAVGFLSALGFSPDGKKIAYTKNKYLRLYDLDTNMSVSVSGHSDLNYTQIQWIGF